MATQTRPAADDVFDLFQATRSLTLALAAPLSDADATVQSMADASPAKWHLAHTSWFFETFVLRDHVPGYRPFDPAYHYLFNSYYDGEGERHPRAARGMLTRPSLDEIRAYRLHVDTALLAARPDSARDLVELGCHHEAQHQELLLTDILHLFAQNPLSTAVWPGRRAAASAAPGPLRWIAGHHGLVRIGHSGDEFAFDCERPRHAVHLVPHALADRLVTNGEWQEFINDNGYFRPELWLSDGWAWKEQSGVNRPFYWQGEGMAFGLDGLHPVDPAEPVAHVSHYEADAYARWAGVRLPTEAEWESAAQNIDPASGNQLGDARAVRPLAASSANGLRQMFGDVWQWTASAFLPHPGFRAAAGAVGEYNGKFMSGQMVLKGASCATPRGSSRASTRNFFPSSARWQFTGLRLAKDL